MEVSEAMVWRVLMAITVTIGGLLGYIYRKLNVARIDALEAEVKELRDFRIRLEAVTGGDLAQIRRMHDAG